MDKEILQEIRNWVRCGFYSQDELREIFCEELYEPDEVDEEEVEQAIAAEIELLKAEQANWPKATDVDKLKAVFDVLNAKGIIALHNAGYTQSDGYEDVIDFMEEHGGEKNFIGYCYYHGQDLERVVRGEGLYLAFGPIDPEKEQTEGIRIGKIIVEELKEHKFEMEWDGTFNQRIGIKNIDWKNRIT